MAVPKRKQLVLWMLSVLNVYSFMFFTGVHGDVPDDVVYTELHKDVRIGDRAVLTCRFRGSPFAVYWKKGYDPIRSPNLVSWTPTEDVTGKCKGQRVCEIMEMNENHSLIIEEVGFAERGRYICRVANYKGNVIHNFTDVSLYAPPKEPFPVIDGCVNNGLSASKPEPCRVQANKTITLTCSVTNYYPNIELFFMHGTRQVTTINQVKQTNVDSTKNKSVSIEAGPSETSYTCIASEVPGSRERKAATIFVESSTMSETTGKRSPTVQIVVPLILLFVIGSAAGGFIWLKHTRRNRKRGHNKGSSRLDTKGDIHEGMPMDLKPTPDERNMESASPVKTTGQDEQSVEADLNVLYNSMQTKYHTLEWMLQDELICWLLSAQINLEICETIEQLENSFQSLVVKFSEVLTVKTEEIKFGLKDYLKNCNLQKIPTQWQDSMLKQLNDVVEQQKNKCKSGLSSIKEARRVDIMQTQKWTNHEAYIMNKVVELADNLKGKDVTDPEKEKRFDIMWVSMVHELDIRTSDLQINLVMTDILFCIFHSHSSLLTHELKRHPLTIPLGQTPFENSITIHDVEDMYIDLNRTSVFNTELIQARHKTVELTHIIMKEISSYLKELSNHNVKFKKSYGIEVIEKLKHIIDTHNQDANISNTGFRILPVYVIKLAVHVSRHCVEVFSSMELEYRLQDYKTFYLSIFKNTMNQSTEEVMAGDLICTKLKRVVQEAVKKAIPSDCIVEVLRDFQMIKYYLIIKMMSDLARKGNFEEYTSYINNAKEFALRWITQYTNEKMFSRQDLSGMTRYAEITKVHINTIIRIVIKSVKDATAKVKGQRHMNMALWVENFCQRVSEKIAVPVSTLTFVSSRSVVDFNNLQKIILKQLGEIEVSLVNTFASVTAYSVDWDGTPPPRQILDKIWGCPDLCPFCNEPCADATPNHFESFGRSHICVQHRPMGIGGLNVSKDQLSLYSCNFLVQSETARFTCKDCNFRCRDHGKCSTTGDNFINHKCTEYKTYMPDWDIAPDSTNSVSKYWMWFMATFQEDLKDMYNAPLTDVPGLWWSITRHEALDDLRIFLH